MARNHDDQSAIRQYLLGQLTADVQQDVEARLLADDELFEELEVTEDELIDEYLVSKLTEDERDRFAQLFLANPERQQKLQFARSLRRYVTTVASQEKSAAVPYPARFWGIRTLALRATAAVAIAVVIVGALWLSHLQTLAPQTFATLTLNISTNNRAEGAQASRVRIPLQADALKISLLLTDTLPTTTRFRVELLKDDGETKTLQITEKDARSVSVVIPATQLGRGHYALRLFAINEDGTEQRINGSYFFTAE